MQAMTTSSMPPTSSTPQETTSGLDSVSSQKPRSGKALLKSDSINSQIEMNKNDHKLESSVTKKSSQDNETSKSSPNVTTPSNFPLPIDDFFMHPECANCLDERYEIYR